MNHQNQSAEDLFAGAIKIADIPARRVYLDHACAGDDALRREVESLLHAHFAAGNFLAQAVAQPQTDVVTEKQEQQKTASPSHASGR